MKNRRKQICISLAISLILSLGSCSSGSAGEIDEKPEPKPEETLSDEEFVEMVEKATFNFFWDAYTEPNGLYLEMLSREPLPTNDWRNYVCSATSTGWGLSAMCIGDTYGWKPREEIMARVLKTLNSLWKDSDDPDDFCVEGHYGAFYHMFNKNTGRRDAKWEVSTTGAALLMGGVIHAMEHFKGTEIETLARKIYENVEWDKMVYEDGSVSAGWNPEDNGLKGEFHMYSEYCLYHLLGLGSPTHPLPEKSWDAWNTGDGAKPQEFPGVGMLYLPGKRLEPSAYLYQMPANWIDFRNLKDKFGIDYWQMGVNGLKANRKICLDYALNKFHNAEQMWGWTACEMEGGYQSFGTAYNATIAPSAVGAAMPYIPDLAMPTLRLMYDKYKTKLYNEKYGFVESFNFIRKYWISKYFLGLDQGNMLVMLENYRTQGVWKECMRSKYIQEGLRRAGFKRYK